MEQGFSDPQNKCIFKSDQIDQIHQQICGNVAWFSKGGSRGLDSPIFLISMTTKETNQPNCRQQLLANQSQALL